MWINSRTFYFTSGIVFAQFYLRMKVIHLVKLCIWDLFISENLLGKLFCAVFMHCTKTFEGFFGIKIQYVAS